MDDAVVVLPPDGRLELGLGEGLLLQVGVVAQLVELGRVETHLPGSADELLHFLDVGHDVELVQRLLLDRVQTVAQVHGLVVVVELVVDGVAQIDGVVEQLLVNLVESVRDGLLRGHDVVVQLLVVGHLHLQAVRLVCIETTTRTTTLVGLVTEATVWKKERL